MEIDSDTGYTENMPAKKVPFTPQEKAAAMPMAAKPAKATKALQPSSAVNQGQTIEDIYQKKTQLEHILLRPDTYIGSTEKQQQKMWVHNGTEVQYADINFVPGLYKIFDEILVNAADNKVRDPKMDTLKVDVDVESCTIKVWNNGDGVPVEMHKEEKVYVPELIFGHLLTSSNYDDSQKKVTGGRNGYGAKLANIFSTEFVIETCDGKRQRRYRQVFSQNMAVKGNPVITACKASENWTCVTFKPDLAKFGMTELEDDTVCLMRKRVYDLAGVLGKGVKVELNGERLPIKSFKDYVDMYLSDKDVPRVHEKVGDRWEVIICATQGQFQQVSFVNSICTTKGGTHVNYLVDQITKGLVEQMGKSKEHKKTAIKPFMVKNYLSVFVNCMIENPAFDSQTKETLTLRSTSFGSKCELSEKFIKKVGSDCGVIDLVASFATFKNNKELKKGDGAKRSRITGVTKLMDANEAGGKHSEECTLILTEGDSAKSLVVGGLSVAGRDKFGVFPLRGKLLNVRDASTTQITGNAEIQNLKQIMGLQHGKAYESIKQLRYGHLMIMTDQDHDGSHIKGLIMNYFHHFYPSLLKMPGFLLEFITPIVKATKGREFRSFYTMPEYEAWCQSESTSGWKIKYYKGLGTSTEEEAQEYFADIDRHRKSFIWQGEEDATCLELAFSKKKIEERKAWLQGFAPGTFLDQSADEISYSDFVNKELILFSRADLERSIPSMVDGFKPGQRKILFACFKKNLKSDIKVAQLSGYVSEHSAYHHGEASLQGTIVGLAQSFVGSNNINLLVPSGQFGTRLQGGKDAASARYIFTRLEKITRNIFHEADDKLLNYLNEEGQSIEPQWYMPILPMVLINGAEGIGTGWSTFIPNFNSRDVVANLRRLLNGEEQQPMSPWYKNFKGTIEEVPSKTGGKSYACHGIASKDGDNVINVTELPVRKWTQDYKEYLEGLIKPEDRGQRPLVVDYKEFHTGANVHFELQLAEGAVPESEPAQLLAKLKLTSKFALSNMVLFDRNGIIRRYHTAEEILADFFELRLDYYGKRREHLIQTAAFELMKLSNKVRFILAVISGELLISNRKKAAIEADMDQMGFERIATGKKAKVVAAAAVDEEEPDEAAEAEQAAALSFDYLLSMAIQSLTLEKVQALRNDEDAQREVVAQMQATTPGEMYHKDLDDFLAALEEHELKERKLLDSLAERQRRAGNKGNATRKAKAAAKKKKKAAGSDSEMEEVSDDDYAPAKAKAPVRKPTVPKAASAAPQSSTTVLAAPAPKRAAAKPKVPKTAAQTESVSTEAAPSSSQGTESAAPEREISLMERLAGRMGNLAVESSQSGPSRAATEKPPPTKKPARAAKAKAKPKVVDSDDESEEASEASFSEDDDEDDDSPAPPPKRAPAKKAIVKPPVAKPAPAAKPAAKRKPAPKPAASAVSRLQSDTAADAESPVVAPQGKVRRMRPSPFHKGSGADKPAAAKDSELQVVSEGEDDDSEVEEVPAAETVAATRPSRRAAASKKTYVEDVSSGEDCSDGDDDFEVLE